MRAAFPKLAIYGKIWQDANPNKKVSDVLRDFAGKVREQLKALPFYAKN